MQTIENKIINRVYGNGRGWSFFKNYFSDLGNAAAIDQALIRLTKRGTIRRVIRGIYDYPKFSKLLSQDLPPDIDQVAQALAGRFRFLAALHLTSSVYRHRCQAGMCI